MPPARSADRGYQGKKTSVRRTPKIDPVWVDGVKPRPMFIDYKDLDLLTKLTNRQAKIVSRRKTGCHAASQHAIAKAVKRARFMALLPYVNS
jgi:small subunit ribosomal protein S18